MKRYSLAHEFVDTIPPQSALEDGRLYISIPYATAVHLCACGCGTKVVTPIKPARWHLKFDGETVSLCPSIGRWQSPCQSHYWIRNNQVQWSKPWTEEQIRAGRDRDRQDLLEYYGNRRSGQVEAEESSASARPGLVQRAWRKLRR